MTAICQICGSSMPAKDYTLHVIVRHWKWAEEWHKRWENADPVVVKIMSRIP